MLNYNALVQDALRDVIRTILKDVEIKGLHGNHRFFITFLTTFPNVKLSKDLEKRFPKRMTIVLQNQFWNLYVNQSYFNVCLLFSDISEEITIPFSSIEIFEDPSSYFKIIFDLSLNQGKKNIESFKDEDKIISFETFRKRISKDKEK